MDATTLVAVVDDEPSCCRALERLLRSAGLDVVTFMSGPAFLQFLESGSVDCVVLDLHMAPMCGLQVQDELCRAGRQLPVVVVTAHYTPNVYQRAIDAGAVACLRKPVDEQVLLDAVMAGLAKLKPPR